MKYKAGSRRRAKEYEKAILEFWKKDETFLKSVEQRGVEKSFVFYDGPPFITGQPHHGTLLASIVKDAVARFWTMRGYRVERRWGWDCHGLPAENFVEKQLGILDRRQIGAIPEGASEKERQAILEKEPGAISLESYILKAKESMVANSETWKGTIDRIGRWVDFETPYRTMDKDFMESVWWAFKMLYEKGKIYEGRKVLMYDTKFGTPVSKAEVTMDNDAYKTVTDPSAFTLFRVHDSASGTITANDSLFFLAWTTTPWTLPANKALAVNPEMMYGVYEVEGKRVIIAEKLVGKVLSEDAKPVETFKGAELAGAEYEDILGRGKRKVFTADFVGDEEGTGIVHVAPAYGEDDYELYLEHQDEMEFEDVLDENGYYLPEMAAKLHELGVRDTDENGIEIWAGNKFIAKVLEEKGIVYKIEYIKHEYPFNPRSKQRIMYRAFPSWFFDIQGSKALMLEKNENVNWFPGHFKEGRFKKNIEAAPDWNLSRDRFFATAMPVWKGDKGSVKVVGSYAELEELSGVRLEDYHRPWVDQITFEIDGEKFTRVEKVLDCWFESGSMPFAQMHYPFENKEKFERNYPADFITEYVGQVRAWFYYVHAVNTALFGEEAFRNVIVTGTLAGNDGRKMSKSLGNFTDPNELMDKFSADSLRFLLLTSPVVAGEDFALLDKDVSDVARKLGMIWNVFDFFCTYAQVDGFDSSSVDTSSEGALLTRRMSNTSRSVAPSSSSEPARIKSTKNNILDRWVVARVFQLREGIVRGMEGYDLAKAAEGVLLFVDDLSNWFVRRSRRRFWKSEDDGDKREAYETLYFVLVYLAEILAPFVPFLAEELYQQMTGAGTSVHLLDFPEGGEVDTEVIRDMARTREVISEGLMRRMRKSETEEQVKVRQPLKRFVYPGEKLGAFYEEIIKDELNVKEVEDGAEYFLDKELTPELREEGFVRELIRVVQSLRKKAGLSVDDRIRLMMTFEIPERFLETVKGEVLAVEVVREGNFEVDEVVEVEGVQGTISLEKA
ncbi:isoleucine--tRNA ligase [Candidatus Saccharibacteria bacterium]|nr:isoleucine--tRNA ligase [Candidatus Saccharibacteria bacterium]